MSKMILGTYFAYFCNHNQLKNQVNNLLTKDNFCIFVIFMAHTKTIKSEMNKIESTHRVMRKNLHFVNLATVRFKTVVTLTHRIEGVNLLGYLIASSFDKLFCQ